MLVGGEAECERIERLLKLGRVNHEILGWVSSVGTHTQEFMGGLDQLSEVLAIYQPDLVIFSGKDVPSTEIMTHMIDFQSLPVQVKIAPERSETIIGSDSKNQPGELFTLEVDYHLAQQHHLRNKRVLDLILCLWVGLFAWVLVWCALSYTILLISVIYSFFCSTNSSNIAVNSALLTRKTKTLLNRLLLVALRLAPWCLSLCGRLSTFELDFGSQIVKSLICRIGLL